MNSKQLTQRLALMSIALGLLVAAGCQTGGSAPSGNVPQAAIAACLQHADQYQNAAPGTATYSGVNSADVAVGNPAESGDNWALKVTVAGVGMLCNVTPDGTVQNIQPL